MIRYALTDKWILAQRLRIPKIQFVKHMKLKKKEDQSVDSLFLIRMGNKIHMEGVTKFGAETEERTKDHPETAPPRGPSHIQPPNPDTIVEANKWLLTGA